MCRAESQRSVERLVYVDLSAGKVDILTDTTGRKEPVNARERLRRLVEVLPDEVTQIARAVDAGDLRCREEPDCSACGVRAICRSCFVTRRYGDDA